MERRLAHLRNREEILELAFKEQDQDMMGAVFEEILRHLDDKQRRLTAPLSGEAARHGSVKPQ